MKWYSATHRHPRGCVESRKKCLHVSIEMRRGLLCDHAEQAASLAKLVIELGRDHMRPTVEVSGKHVKVYVYR